MFSQPRSQRAIGKTSALELELELIQQTPLFQIP